MNSTLATTTPLIGSCSTATSPSPATVHTPSPSRLARMASSSRQPRCQSDRRRDKGATRVTGHESSFVRLPPRLPPAPHQPVGVRRTHTAEEMEHLPRLDQPAQGRPGDATSHRERQNCHHVNRLTLYTGPLYTDDERRTNDRLFIRRTQQGS